VKVQRKGRATCCGGLERQVRQKEEVIGGKALALDSGEVDLDLIEPTGMDRV
jgi:hypothetical protein